MTGGQPVEVTDPGETIGSFQDRWLVCRDLGHGWRHRSFAKEASGPYYLRVLRCTSCRTERRDLVNLWGSIVSRRYVYPDGYQLRGLGDLGVSRDDFRREVMRRAGIDEVHRRKGWNEPSGNGQAPR